MGRDDQGRHRTAQHCRIWVRGRLDEHFSDGLPGIAQEDVPAGTMLHGEMLDQSQVHSILDLLRSLGIEVVRFEVDPHQPDRSARLGEPAEATRHPHKYESTQRPGERERAHDQEKS